MNTLKTKSIKLKNHIKKNKAAWTWGAVAVTAIVLQHRNLKAFDRFLNEKGIDPLEFYCPEAYAELT